MRPPTFSREGGHRLTAFPPLPPLAPPFSWCPSLPGASSQGWQAYPLRALEVSSRGEHGLLPGVGVPGTFMPASGSRGPGGSPGPLPWLSMQCSSGRHGADGGAHPPVLCLGLEHLLGGPMCDGPTLTASGEPHVPLLRRARIATYASI